MMPEVTYPSPLESDHECDCCGCVTCRCEKDLDEGEDEYVEEERVRMRCEQARADRVRLRYRAWELVRSSDHSFVGDLEWGRAPPVSDDIWMRCVTCTMRLRVSTYGISWSHHDPAGPDDLTCYAKAPPSCFEIVSPMLAEVMDA